MIVLVGVSFFSWACVARVTLAVGLLCVGVSFLADTSDRVDFTVVLVEDLETDDSGVSYEDPGSVKTTEFGRDFGLSLCPSAETLSLFCGDSPSFTRCGGGGGGASALSVEASRMSSDDRFLDFSVSLADGFRLPETTVSSSGVIFGGGGRVMELVSSGSPVEC